MRKLIAACVIVSMVFVASGMAQAEKMNAEFTDVIRGALSYDATGANVVVPGNAFYDMLKSSSTSEPLGVMSGGSVLTGNFAFYGVCHYEDTQGLLTWAMANATTPLGLELRTHGVQFDTSGNGETDFIDNFTLDVTSNVGFPVSFAELAADGYTDLTYGQGGTRVWLDIALNQPGMASDEVAISLIMDNYLYGGGAAELQGATAFVNAEVVPDDLWSATWNTNLSGIRINPVSVPEPSTLILLGLGGLCLLFRKRKA